MSLIGCTISGNIARNAGGGIFNVGSLLLDSTTVSGNGASYGGNVYNAGTMTVQNFSSITDIDNVGMLNRDNTSTIGSLISVVAPLEPG
jgi:hypothetical protein